MPPGLDAVRGSRRLDDLGARDGRQVGAARVDLDGRGGGQHLEQPQVACVGGPAVAEDWLVVAVD